VVPRAARKFHISKLFLVPAIWRFGAGRVQLGICEFSREEADHEERLVNLKAAP
jgi:hypothetical protein